MSAHLVLDRALAEQRRYREEATAELKHKIERAEELKKYIVHLNKEIAELLHAQSVLRADLQKAARENADVA